MSPYIRTVKTASGATAVQIAHSSRRGSRDIEHIGSAHTEVDVELLKAAAKQRLVANQDAFFRFTPTWRAASDSDTPSAKSRPRRSRLA